MALTEDLIELCALSKYVGDDLEIEYKPDVFKLTQPADIIYDKKKNVCTSLSVLCTAFDRTRGEKVDMHYDVLYIPYNSELLQLNGSNKQVVSEQRFSAGWYVSTKQKDRKECHFIRLKRANGRMDSSSLEIKETYETNSKSKRAIALKQLDYGSSRSIIATLRLPNEDLQKKTKTLIPVDFDLGIFLKAYTGLSLNDILDKIGYTPSLAAALNSSSNGECTRTEALRIMYTTYCSKVKNSGISEVGVTPDQIYRELFVKTIENENMPLEQTAKDRLVNTISFKSRALNKVLAEDITLKVISDDSVVDKTIRKETNLDVSLLELIDASEIDELKILYDNKIYNLKKFSDFKFRAYGKILFEDAVDPLTGKVLVKKNTLLGLEELAILNDSNLAAIKLRSSHGHRIMTRRMELKKLEFDDLFLALNIFFNALEGYPYKDDEYSLENRKFVSLDTIIYSRAKYWLKEISNSIVYNYLNNDSTLKLTKAMQHVKLKPGDILDSLRDTSNKFTQTANLTNALATQMMNAKTDMGGNFFSEELRNIAMMSEGRIDPIVTPESTKVGIVTYRTVVSDVNKNGEIVTPFIRYKNGIKISNTPVYLSALEEQDKYVINFDTTLTRLNENGEEEFVDYVYARYNGSTVKVSPQRVDLQDYSAFQSCCIARALVPFRNSAAAKRQTMAANHQMQSLKVLKSERPIVGTGAESLVSSWYVTAEQILSDFYESNKLAEKDIPKDIFTSAHIVLRNIKEGFDTRTVSFTIDGFEQYKIERTITFMLHNSKMSVYSTRINDSVLNLRYSGKDIVFYDMSYDITPRDVEVIGDFSELDLNKDSILTGLGLGVNLNVVYKTFEGSTIDDAIVINQDLIGDDKLTSVNLYKHQETLIEPTEDCTEIFCCSRTKNTNSEAPSTRHLGPDGIPPVGAYIRGGEPIISITRITRGDKDGEESITQSVRTIDLPAVEEGEIVYSNISGNTATVLIASTQPIETGDKLTGRHGNKSVIGKIVPAHLMPFDDDGNVMDIILNPLGVPSRSNLSQIIEVVVAMAMKKKGKFAVISCNVPPLELAKRLAEEMDVKPKMLRDGRTGQYFKRSMNVGIMYILKAEHMVSHKVNSVGIPTKVDSISGQLQQGRTNKGGQAIGEMEFDLFRAVDCNKIIDDLASFYSSDINGRQELKAQITANPLSIELEGTNDNNRFLEAFLKPMGIKVETKGDAYFYSILTDRDIRALSKTPVDVADPRVSLRSAHIFGSLKCLKNRMALRNQWSYIDLGCKIVNPLFIYKGALSKLLVSRVKVVYLTEGIYSKNIEHIQPTLLEFKQKVYVDLLNYTSSIDIIDDQIIFYPSNSASVVVKDSGRKHSNKTKSIGSYTGITAIVKLLEYAKIEDALEYYEGLVSKAEISLSKVVDKIKSKYELSSEDELNYCTLSSEESKSISNGENQLLEAKAALSKVEAFRDSGITYTDFIIENYPVLPIIYRPEPIKGRYQDFDEFYVDICNAVMRNKSNNSFETQTDVFNSIEYFLGVIDRKGDNKPSGRTPLLSKFSGTKREGSPLSSDKHGLLRDTLGRRRVSNSGRSTIIPSANVNMDMLHLGIPEIMAVDTWDYHLASYLTHLYCKNIEDTEDYISPKEWIAFLKDVINDKIDDNNYLLEANRKISRLVKPSQARKHMKDFIEGNPALGIEPQVVLYGRQPSLHVNSARSYYVTLVKGKAIQIHPLVCKGYNADFDGDQMWYVVILTEEAKKEAIEKMSYLEHMIASKDLSIMVDPQQDMRIGCYMATMLKDNALEIPNKQAALLDTFYTDSIEELIEAVKDSIIEPYNLVCYTHTNGKKYLSTAGRIWFNSLLPDTFTEETFTNPLNLPTEPNKEDDLYINPTGYCELVYDGLVSKSAGIKKGMVYKSLGDITAKITRLDTISELEKVAVFQKIMEFGLYFSDISGLSFTLEDLEINPKRELYIKAAQDACNQLDEDYKAGLVSEKNRRAAFIEINDVCTKKFSDVLVDEMRRDNNIFIMLDSGARGNKTQVNQALGIIGVLSKSKTEKIDAPIYSNFALGLNELEQFNSSYAGRIGINSTQNETSVAGEVQRKAAFNTSVLRIVEEDCGRDEYADDMYIKLRYTELKEVTKVTFPDTNALYDRTEESAVLEDVLNHDLDESDNEWFMVHFKNFIENGRLIPKSLPLIQKYTLTRIKCKDCIFELRYVLDDMSKTQLLYRVAFGLPYLIEDKYISEDTIQYIEENNLKDIRVRTVLNCRSIGGICAKCYGLMYHNKKLPKVGSNIAMESSMAIGEPSSQLTLNVVHTLGTQGGELSSGVAFLGSLLEGATSNFGSKVYNGEGAYAKVLALGRHCSVSVDNEPDFVMAKNNIAIIDGEYLDKYTPITAGLIDPNTIGFGKDIASIMERQYTLLQLYYDNYRSNGIKIMTRHFEMLVRSQGSVAKALETKNGYRAGILYNLYELIAAEVPYKCNIVSSNVSVNVNGGTMTAITNRDSAANLIDAVLTRRGDKNNSSLGAMIAGESMQNRHRVSISIESELKDKNLTSMHTNTKAFNSDGKTKSAFSRFRNKPVVSESVIEKNQVEPIESITPEDSMAAMESMDVIPDKPESSVVLEENDLEIKRMSML